MTVTININGLTLCHRASGGITHNTLPDVCKTPEKGVPLPFDNEAYSKDLANGTSTVFADGGNMIGNFGSIFATSILDEGGSYGGVISGTFMAEADFITHSFDVFFEGKPACRLTDKMWMNHRNTVNMAGLDQLKLKAENKLCAAICYCSNTVRAATAAGTSLLDMDFWAAAVIKSGGIPTGADVAYRTQEECVAKQFSSGWPLYTPKEGSEDYLAEATYDMTQNPFKLLTSESDPPRLLSNGQLAPMSPIRAINKVGKGKTYAAGDTFRPDFVMLRKSGGLAEGDNVLGYIEIKFDKDKLTDNQEDARAILKQRGEGDKFLILTEEECCGDEQRARNREIRKIIEQTGASARKVMGLFFPPVLGGLPVP